MTLRAHLRAAIAGLPDGAHVSLPVEWLRSRLTAADDEHTRVDPVPHPIAPVTWTWKEMLWCCPSETRLGVEETREALGKSASWVYKRTGESVDPVSRLPARRAHGQLTFVAGELRTWIRAHEDVLHALPMTTTDSERRAFGLVSGDAA